MGTAPIVAMEKALALTLVRGDLIVALAKPASQRATMGNIRQQPVLRFF